MRTVAEIIERRGGLAYGQFVRKRVLDPLGLDSIFVGLPAAENDRVLPVEHYGAPPTEADYQRLGMRGPPPAEINEQILLAFNQPDVRAVGVPGAGGFANAADLALFYQALLHGTLEGPRIWSEKTLASARRVRTGQLADPIFRQLANRGLGTVVCGDKGGELRGFGKANSPESFGHPGAGGQLAWADPATGLSLAYLTPGHDRNLFNPFQRGAAISHLAAQCAV